MCLHKYVIPRTCPSSEWCCTWPPIFLLQKLSVLYTQKLLCFWSVILFFTSASRSDYFAIFLLKEVFILLWLLSLFLLYSTFQEKSVLHTTKYGKTHKWSDNKVQELAIVCLPWQHWTKALVWFDDIDISAFHSCVVVDLWQSLSE